MIALVLLLAAQAVAPAPDAPPAPAPVLRRRVCHQAPGSEIVTCELRIQQPSGYRLPKYGPAAPQADRGTSVRLGAKATNRGSARRNRSMATVGIPF